LFRRCALFATGVRARTSAQCDPSMGRAMLYGKVHNLHARQRNCSRSSLHVGGVGGGRNNTAPGRFRIEIAPAGQAPHVIKPVSPLPAIKGPVAIEGAAWKRSGEFTVLDGSGYIEDKGPQTCPSTGPGPYGTNVRTTTNPGLAFVDTQGVEISGLEVRNFCIGVLIHRSSGNSIHDNRIVANRGGAGVMLTGDDGNGNPTATTTVHNKVLRNEFLDNGDGLELTRGAAFNLVADNVFRSTDANPEPSQGIEIPLGNDNTVVSNRFEGYSDGLQINWGHRNYIAANIFTNNTFGLSLSGAGNIIDGNVISGTPWASRCGRQPT
jgi:3-dehydroshikimate dehydratase